MLLCPFDNLVWDRAFLQRVFGFDHVIEVYKPEPQRVFGYYVLPFLYGDRLVGRVDLKSDRAEGVLRVKAVHLEPKVGARARSRPRSTGRSTGSPACSISIPSRGDRGLTGGGAAASRCARSCSTARRRGVLDTVRRLGFLQIDPISTVAPPQYLVLWSRLGPYDRNELDRLFWEERTLVEWDAFIWPVEDLPL